MPDPGSPVTIKSFAQDLMAWESLEWFRWPPDLFAFTSLLLKVTGAYRFVVLPPKDLAPWPEEPDWTGLVRERSQDWRNCLVTGGDPGVDLFAKELRIFDGPYGQVSIEDIRRLGTSSEKSDLPWEVCRVVLYLHAVADEACRGFGLPSGFNSRMASGLRPEASTLAYMANILLARTGTLSRLPKHKALVLPKMRVPQVGLTLRSLSHNVTVHQTEANVVWRTAPWVNIDENTINMLIVPWPRIIRPTWFKPAHHFVRRQSGEHARFFLFDRGDFSQDMEEVIKLLKLAEASVNRVHIIVFPELALTDKEFKQLKTMLASVQDRDRMPMIITGVTEQGSLEAGNPQLGGNRVVLSTFFGGKWYDLAQDKHHRWKLDESQIQQYNIGGVLSGDRDWWEAIEITQRGITFLAPNGWLTLCPLICEDLARFEPISELIRGVGPTLLVALLLDGPQRRDRWPGRYASVLADDPGCSVLTVTATGMIDRSKPRHRDDFAVAAAANPATGAQAREIALWKDPLSGWKDIRLEPGEDAVVLTVTARWQEEYTADGRGDGKSAAVLVFEGTTGLRLTDYGAEASFFKEGRREFITGVSMDALELSEFSYLADAALDLDSHLVDSLAFVALGDEEKADSFLGMCRPYRELLARFRGIGLPGEDFRFFLDRLALILNRKPFPADLKLPPADIRQGFPSMGEFTQLISYWDTLVDFAEEILQMAEEKTYKSWLSKEGILWSKSDMRIEEHDLIRALIYSALAVLWAVHKRLTRTRRRIGLTVDSAQLLGKIEKILVKKYDLNWYAVFKRRIERG